MTRDGLKAKTPRRQPKQERSAFTHAAIIDAAERVLGELGLEGASMAQIARTAGVSAGTLYQYFPTREALLAAWEERVLAEELARFMGALQERMNDPLEEVAAEAVRVATAAIARLVRLHQATGREMSLLSREAERQELSGRLAEFVRAFLESRHSEIDVEDLGAASKFLVTCVFNTALYGAIEYPDLAASGVWGRELARMITRYVVRPK